MEEERINLKELLEEIRLADKVKVDIRSAIKYIHQEYGFPIDIENDRIFSHWRPEYDYFGEYGRESEEIVNNWFNEMFFPHIEEAMRYMHLTKYYELSYDIDDSYSEYVNKLINYKDDYSRTIRERIILNFFKSNK